MRTIIMAGGQPSTIAETGDGIPKPMAEIGERPLLWHIMKQFSWYGFRDFIVCAGYKSELIKQYFMDYYIYQSDITIDLMTNQVEIHKKKTEDWSVTVLDTGKNSSIVERLFQTEEYIDEDAFIVTYGDCLSNINIRNLVKTHLESAQIATLAIARPAGRNRILSVDGNGRLLPDLKKGELVKNAWANANTMVLSKKVFCYLRQNGCTDETELFQKLAYDKKIGTYCHDGYWTPVETKRDKIEMETLWKDGNSPWKVWED